MGTELVNLTNDIAKNDFRTNESILQFLDRNKDFVIPIMPDTFNTGGENFNKINLTAISFSKENTYDPTGKFETPEEKRDGKIEGNRTLNLQKLNEIAQASGFIVTDSRPIERVEDANGKVKLVRYRITWEVPNADGTIRRGVNTGKWDYETDTAKFKKDYQKEMQRKDAESLAESRALARAIRKAIPQIPTVLTPNDFKKVLVVSKPVMDPNALFDMLPEGDSRNRAKESYVYTKLKMAEMLYGGKIQQEKALPEHIEVAEKIDYDDEEPEVYEPEEVHQEEPVKTNEPTLEEQVKMQVATLKEAPQEERNKAYRSITKELGLPEEAYKDFEKKDVREQLNMLYKIELANRKKGK